MDDHLLNLKKKYEAFLFSLFFEETQESTPSNNEVTKSVSPGGPDYDGDYGDDGDNDNDDDDVGDVDDDDDVVGRNKIGNNNKTGNVPK